jgi:hypothetical protein
MAFSIVGMTGIIVGLIGTVICTVHRYLFLALERREVLEHFRSSEIRELPNLESFFALPQST